MNLELATTIANSLHQSISPPMLRDLTSCPAIADSSTWFGLHIVQAIAFTVLAVLVFMRRRGIATLCRAGSA